jgi:hypothetical protein
MGRGFLSAQSALVHLVVGWQEVPTVAEGEHGPMKRDEVKRRETGSESASLLTEVITATVEARKENWWRNLSASCVVHMCERGLRVAGWVLQLAGFGMPGFAGTLKLWF